MLLGKRLTDGEGKSATQARDTDDDPRHVVVDDTALEALDGSHQAGPQLESAAQHGQAPPVERQVGEDQGAGGRADAGEDVRLLDGAAIVTSAAVTVVLIVLMVQTAHADVVYWFAAGDRDVMRAAPRPAGRGTASRERHRLRSAEAPAPPPRR